MPDANTVPDLTGHSHPGSYHITGNFLIFSQKRCFRYSVADPGRFIPDLGSGSDHCSIPDPEVKKHRIPDPTYFCIKAINKFCLLILDPEPTIAPSQIPDPGGKNAPDPGSGSATLIRYQDLTMVKA
jgi:hypothetical protein